MSSPFLWRHAGILLIVAAHFAFSAMAVYKAQTNFRPSALASSIAFRAGSVAYFAVSLLILLLAIAMFSTLETGPHAIECWRNNRIWRGIQPGMTRAQVIQLLGEPAEIRFNNLYVYDMHPMTVIRTGYIEFESSRDSNQPLKDSAKVTSKDPEHAIEWMPPGFSTSFRHHLSQDILVISACGIAVLALASLIPFGVQAGWNSWSLYIPIAALVLATAYEYASSGRGGWRFDLYLLVPCYLLIGAMWLARLYKAWKS